MHPIPPFSQCEEEIFTKEKGKCAISKTPIRKGDPVFRFKFSDYSDVPAEYAKKDVFLKTEEYVKSYKEKFLAHKYSINDFLERSYYYSFYHSTIKDAVTDIKKVMQVVAHPPLKPLPYYYHSELGGKLAPYLDYRENRDATSHPEIFQLIAIYLNCGYADYFLKHLEELPVPAWFLFAMSNDLRFQEKISNILKINVSDIFNILSKPRLVLDDILKIIDTVDNNKIFLQNFSKFIDISSSLNRNYACT